LQIGSGMTMNKFTEQQIIESWQTNVQAWTDAIRHGEIASRTLVTNRAIIDAVKQRQPETVLDIGCGEGWLVRELAGLGVEALGIDAIQEFVAVAMKQAVGRFERMAYAEISRDKFNAQFDVIVCNFSLLGEASVEHVFRQAPSLLRKGGALIVQTLHPVAACGEQPYLDGWREGSWAGFSNAFTAPAPWYFRTIESWKALFESNGFHLSQTTEPVHPATQQPVSIIFAGEILE